MMGWEVERGQAESRPPTFKEEDMLYAPSSSGFLLIASQHHLTLNHVGRGQWVERLLLNTDQPTPRLHRSSERARSICQEELAGESAYEGQRAMTAANFGAEIRLAAVRDRSRDVAVSQLVLSGCLAAAK